MCRLPPHFYFPPRRFTLFGVRVECEGTLCFDIIVIRTRGMGECFDKRAVVLRGRLSYEGNKIKACGLLAGVGVRVCFAFFVMMSKL